MNIRRIQVASPLTLVVLSACGGSSGGGALSALINGTAINGPLFGARVFLDVADANGNFDGVYNAADDILASNNGLTDELGDFSVDTSGLAAGATYRIVVESLDTTVINYGGANPEDGDLQPAGGFTLTAPEDSSVVTPITTLIEQGGLTPADVATALGLDGVDLLTFNPFDTTDTATAVKAEKVSMQVVTTLETLSSAAESAGAGGADAASAAVGALVSVITAKVTNEETLDLAPDNLNDPNNDIAALTDNFKTELTAAGVNTAAITALEDEIERSIQVVNSGIEDLPEDVDLTSADSKNTFSAAKLLSEQVSDAVTSGNAADISFTNEAAFAASAANAAPTGVALSNNEINEGALENRLIGTLSLEDGDATNSNPVFEILSSEADGALFEITENNKLQVKEGSALDFESADHENGIYTVYVKGIDDGGKSTIEKIEIQSKDVAEPPTLDASTTTATEDAAFTYTITATDPEGDTVQISIPNLPSWLTFSSSTGVLTGTPDNDLVGDVVLSVVLTDSTGLSATETLTITVENVNDAPTISTTSLSSVAQDAAFSQVITASDVDAGDTDLTIAMNASGSADWLSFDASTNTLSGTPGSGDVGTNTVTLTVTDANGGSSSKVLEVVVSNVNDAPVIADPSVAAIVEGPDGAANTETNLTGTLDVTDPDTPFDSDEVLTFSLDASDTSVASQSQTHTTLTVNSDKTYSVTYNANTVDALKDGDSATETYTIYVTDTAGLQDSATLTVNITGANNEPTITVTNSDLSTLSNLGAGQFVGALTATDDVDEADSIVFTLAAASASNDNDDFIISDNNLNLKSSVTTDFSSQSSYSVDVIATDSTGATATATLSVGVSSTNARPSISSITTNKEDGVIGIGGELVFTALASEAVNAGSSFSISLSNGSTVTMTRSTDDTTPNLFSGTYTVAEGDDTASNTALSVSGYTAGTVVESSYADGETPATMEASSATVDIGTLEVDATYPTAVVSNTGHTYDASTGVLTLAGSNFLTLGEIVSPTNGDPDYVTITDAVDVTKITWNIDGAGTETLALATTDVASITATTSAMTITLNATGTGRLHVLEGFGGTSATGGTADLVDVATSFLKDAAGNVSSAEVAVSDADVTLSDSARPTISTVAISPNETLFGIGDTITITLTMSEDIRADSSVTMALSNGASLSFTVPSGSTDTLTADYTVEAGQDVTDSDTFAIQALSSVSVLDVSGNKLSDDITEIFSTSPTNGLTAVKIDATAPTASIAATGHTYDASTGVLTLTGSALNSMGIAAYNDGVTTGDVSSVVDVTKLTWDIDGEGASTMTLTANDVASVILKDSATLEITLNAGDPTADPVVGRAKLHALADFGGATATGGTADALDIAAGFLTDAAGNISTGLASPVANAEVAMTDTTAPVINTDGITSDASDGQVVGVGSIITISAQMSEAMRAGTEMLVTLSTGGTAVLTPTSGDATIMSGPYQVGASDLTTFNDADATTLKFAVSNYTINTAVDISGNQLDADTAVADIDDLASPIIDTTPPTATIAATGHTYDVSTGVITLSGTNFDTMGIAAKDNSGNSGDASSVVDITKLSWDIDGAGDNTMTLASADVASVILVDATTIEITLATDGTADPAIGQEKLHALADFGGTSATGGVADTIDVAIGFLSDTAGNVSTGLASPVANAEVTLADVAAPTISSITTDASADSFNGVGTDIVFTATMASSENMKAGGSMTVTLNNSVNVTLTTSGSDANTMVGTYTVGAEDVDTSALEIASYSVGTAVDLSGNLLADDTTISDIDGILANVAVDTTAPQLTIQTYVGSELVLAFNEAITNAKATELETAVANLTEVTGTSWSSSSNNTTFKIAASSLSAGDSLNIDDVTVEDVAGNTLLIETLEII